MATDTVTLVYSMIGGFMILGLGAIVLVVAGKSIFFEFYRRMVPRGVDVFIVNSSRQLSQHYKLPKDGQVHVNKKMYVTNPDKLLSMEESMKEEIKNSMGKKKKRFEKKILQFQKKVLEKETELEKLSDVPANQATRAQYQEYITTINSRIKILQNTMVDREQVYYNKKRGAFFYIEGDPIPKDFHEWYTEMDSLSIDNVIARSMTKDPKAVKDLEKEIKMMKFLIIITLIAAAVSAIIGVTLKTDIQTIAANIGVTLTL